MVGSLGCTGYVHAFAVLLSAWKVSSGIYSHTANDSAIVLLIERSKQFLEAFWFSTVPTVLHSDIQFWIDCRSNACSELTISCADFV